MGRLLLDKRYEEIKQVVADLYERYSITTIPVDPYGLAKRMGITLVPYSTLKESVRSEVNQAYKDGFKYLLEDLDIGEGTWYVWYDDEQSDERIRFTILHEIGHIVLGHLQESELAELEANFFAKFAIAPPILVNIIAPTDYVDIANAFGLSAECAYYSMNYYLKWKAYGGDAPYSHQLIRLFTDEDGRGGRMLRMRRGA